MFTSLPRVLGNDRAESSLMVVISQQVGLILMVALAGVMFVLISGGQRIQDENNGQTELRIANRAFENDVETASRVYVTDDTRLTLTSTNWLKNEAGEFVCRASEWYLAPASEQTQKMRDGATLTLYNDITTYADDTCTGDPTSTQHRIAVTALDDDNTRFVYTNIAGVRLSFTNGIVTGLNGEDYLAGSIGLDPNDATTMTTFRDENHIDAWYTDEEVIRELPRVIAANLRVILPITEVNDTVFKATTDQGEAELIGNNDDVVDPGGEQSRWIPNVINNVFINRSTNPSTGTIVGGVREGITLSWTPRPTSECAPSQTLTYAWLLTDSAGRRATGETTASSAEVDTATGAARIWNGGNYSASVAARCNDTDGASPAKSATGSLSLPNVLGVAVAAPGAETSQTVTWERASSDPSTSYAVRFDRADSGSTYTKATPVDVAVWQRASPSWSNLGTTPSLAFGHTTPSAVPGFPEVYAVRAATADTPNSSGQWSPGNFIYQSGTAAIPSITSLAASSMTWAANACPTGNAADYQARVTPSDGSAAASGITSATSMTFTSIGQGARVFGYVMARCSTPYTLDPANGQSGLSPWSAEDDASYIRPVSPPSGITMNGVSTTVYNGTAVYRYGVSVDGCAAGTTARWVTDNEYVGGSLSNTSRTSSPSGYCDGAYADSGPVGRSATITWVTPPAPSTPTNGGIGGGEWHTKSTGGAIVTNFTWSGSGSTNASGYTTQTRLNLAGGASTAWVTSSSQGCAATSTISIQGRAQAYGPGGTSGWNTSGSMGYSLLNHASTCEA